jgi:FecR protein
MQNNIQAGKKMNNKISYVATAARVAIMAFATLSFAQTPPQQPTSVQPLTSTPIPRPLPAPPTLPSSTALPNTQTTPVTNPAPPAMPPAAAKEIKVVEINSAARVVFAEGEVNVIGTNNQRRLAKVGETIFEGDSIVTGKDGELHLDMEDGGYISVRPNTKMRVIKYQAKGNESDTSVLGLLEGSFRAVTGWIGKFNQQKYVIRTPNATIGIRGTDHEPLVIPKGATGAEGEPGTYDKVNIGGSTIRTPQGNANVEPGKSAFVGHDAKPPRVLNDVPKFFRAARNERLVEGKHAAIQERILERREARRNDIKTRLDADRKRDNEIREKRQAERKAQMQKKREEKQNAKQAARQGAKANMKDGKDGRAARKEGKAGHAHR